MKYVSTRGAYTQGERACDTRGKLSACEAIIKGISDDGGLFVPSSFPHLDGKLIDELMDMSYPERVATVLSLYLDDFTYKELLVCANRAYAGFDGDICPVVKVEDGLYMLELTHGQSSSIKDMWGALFAQLLCLAKQKIGCKDKTLVLIAANGDAGTLDGYKNMDGVDVAVFYPSKEVSPVQKLQLVTESSDNIHVAGVNGGFDGVRNEIYRILGDKSIKSRLSDLGYTITTANSANIGCLLPLVASYISSYIDLLSDGEIGPQDKVNFVIPSEDFDCAIAGYYAYRMGLPVNKLIIAANANNKVVNLFNNGVLDINGDFYKTLSQSMDVLVPSNLERLIYEVFDRDGEYVRELYAGLAATGKFELDPETMRDGVLEAGWADEEETKEAIFAFFDLDDYVLDTHTAVCVSVYNDYSYDTGDDTPTVIAVMTSPFKSTGEVFGALGGREKDLFKAMLKLQNVTGMECPEGIYALNGKDEIHTDIIQMAQIADKLLEYVKAE